MNKELENLTVKKPHLRPDTFIVRWPLSLSECEKIDQPGTTIEVKEYLQASPMVSPTGEKVDVCYLVRTCKGGLVPVSYLQRRPDYEMTTAVEKKLLQERGWVYQDWRLGTGRWWAGRVTPPEAAGRLVALSWTVGSFAVCQPPEWHTDTAWSPFCLLVRSRTGSIEQIWHEWRETEYYNMRFGKAIGERAQTYDILPRTPPCPPHGLLYFVIQRTALGEFYIEEGSSFISLEILLGHYYEKPLPTANKYDDHLFLRLPADVNTTPWSSPRPLLFRQKFKGYKKGKFKLVKEQKPGLTTATYPNVMWNDILVKRSFVEETKSRKDIKIVTDVSRRGYMRINGAYHPVVMRTLLKFFASDGFEKDMTRIHHADASNYPKAHPEIFTSPDKMKPTFFRQGANFLSHIVCYGDAVEKSNWIAYEAIAGVGLDRLMTIRRYDDWWMSPRTRLEIAYQVAGGMRFLEENLLCHRHLRAANVVCYSEHLPSLCIKITDYMIPYSFMDGEFVKKVELAELEYPWMAPECLLNRCFDIVSDVWAYGCFLFELLHDGMTPYALEDNRPMNADDLARVFKEKRKITTCPAIQDTYCEDLIGVCMRYDGDERPTFDYLFNYLRQLLFDATVSPDKTNEKFLSTENLPKSFVKLRKWIRVPLPPENPPKKTDDKKEE